MGPSAVPCARSPASFAPPFIFVAPSVPLLPHVQRSPVFRALLDGVSAAPLALLAGVSWQFARAAIRDLFPLVLAGVTPAVLLRWRVNSAWLVLGGAVAGVGARFTGLG